MSENSDFMLTYEASQHRELEAFCADMAVSASKTDFRLCTGRLATDFSGSLAASIGNPLPGAVKKAIACHQ